jgi:hypothetical protein
VLIKKRKEKTERRPGIGMVVHVCNPSYSGNRAVGGSQSRADSGQKCETVSEK